MIWIDFRRLALFLLAAPYLFVLAAILLIIGLQHILPLSAIVNVVGAVVVILPIVGGFIITSRLKSSATAASTEHPSKFLQSWRNLRILAYLPYALAAILLYLVVYMKTNFGQYGLLAAIVELWVVELNLEFLSLRSWGPKSEDFLRASLKSVTDPERGMKVYSDSAIRHFNALIHSKHLGLRVRENLNLEVLLFGSRARRTSSSEDLLALSERHDYKGFIDYLASLASKPPSDILQRDSIIEDLHQRQGTIFALALTLILSYSTLQQLLAFLYALVLPK